MANFSQTCMVLLIFLASSFETTLSRVVNGNVCSENLGPCGGDCDARCASAHPGGRGVCDSSSMCQCFFECPKLQDCHISLGIYATGCRDDQCNAQCLQKLLPPTALYVQGFCFSTPPYVSCRCDYKAVKC